jgi:hypothetical protein
VSQCRRPLPVLLVLMAGHGMCPALPCCQDQVGRAGVQGRLPALCSPAVFQKQRPWSEEVLFQGMQAACPDAFAANSELQDVSAADPLRASGQEQQRHEAAHCVTLHRGAPHGIKTVHRVP